MRPFSILLVSLSISLSAWSQKLVILGDSITEGYGVSKEQAYPYLLEQKLKKMGKEITIINSGVSGSTTASASGRLKWVLKSKPETLLLVLGANDGLRGLSVEASQKNLSQAIESAQKSGVKVILGGLYMPPNYGKDYTEKFAKMYSSLAKEHKVKLIPFILEGVGGVPKYNLADGIHPNEEGHKIIADNIFKVIKDEL